LASSLRRSCVLLAAVLICRWRVIGFQNHSRGLSIKTEQNTPDFVCGWLPNTPRQGVGWCSNWKRYYYSAYLHTSRSLFRYDSSKPDYRATLSWVFLLRYFEPPISINYSPAMNQSFIRSVTATLSALSLSSNDVRRRSAVRGEHPTLSATSPVRTPDPSSNSCKAVRTSFSLYSRGRPSPESELSVIRSR
jgi:hypothetical protein